MTPDSFSLSGRKAAVLGGFGLIGRAIAAALHGAGADVTVLDLAGAGAAGEPGTKALPFDISRTEDLEAQVVAAEEASGGFDVWINAAYPRTADWGSPDAPAESLRANIDMQLSAVCLVCDAVAPRMAARGGGSVINLGSIYGSVAPDFSLYDGTGMNFPAAYTAVKGGLDHYGRYLAARWGREGVRVNTVSPGGVFDNQHPDFVKRYEAKVPLGRMATPADVAQPVLFLASDAAAYITGTTLMVDGGWTAI